MSNVYKGQSLLTIKLETGLDISSASVKKINYKKPNGTIGSWVATVDGTTKLSYNVNQGDINQSGKWKMQAFVTIGGKDGYGDSVEVDFKKQFQ
jgi:hypothetical protein